MKLKHKGGATIESHGRDKVKIQDPNGNGIILPRAVLLAFLAEERRELMLKAIKGASRGQILGTAIVISEHSLDLQEAGVKGD